MTTPTRIVRSASRYGIENTPCAISWSLHETDDGGFATVMAASFSKPEKDTRRPWDEQLEKKEHVFLSIAQVSPEGSVEMHRCLSQTDYPATLPDERGLLAIAEDFIDSARLPESYGTFGLEWEAVSSTSELYDFVTLGFLDIPMGIVVVRGGNLSRAIKARFRQLVKAEGSLHYRLSRHHADPYGLITFASSAEWARQLIQERPWLTFSFLKDLKKDGFPTEPFSTETLAEALGEHCYIPNHVSPAAVAWCDRFFARNAVPAPEISFLIVLTALPRSWWPANVDDYTALRVISPQLLSFCDFDAAETVDMLRPAKGRFAEYLTVLGNEIRSPGYVAGKAFVPGSVPYLKEQENTYLRVAMALSDCTDLLASIDTHLVSPFRGPPVSDSTMESARRIVTRGGGIRRFIEASKRWHAQPALPGRLHTAAHAWPRCVEPFHYDGIDIKELCTAAELWEEGVRMGHCVGGDNYVTSCMQGESRIVSLRIDGESLSTAEFDFHNIISLRQHRGPGNSNPRGRPYTALVAWVAAIESGELTIQPVVAVPMPEVAEISLPGNGPVAWRPFIRRDLAYLSWEEFGKQVMELHSHPKPEDRLPPPAPGM